MNIRLLPYGRRRPRRSAAARCWLVWFRRTGPGAGKACSMAQFPGEWHWREIKAVRQWFRSQPSDTPMAALMTGAHRVTAPMVVRRQLLAAGVPREGADRAAAGAYSAEWGECEPEPNEAGDLRVTRIQPTGRWVTPEGDVIEGSIPAGTEVPAGTILPVKPVEPALRVQ